MISSVFAALLLTVMQAQDVPQNAASSVLSVPPAAAVSLEEKTFSENSDKIQSYLREGERLEQECRFRKAQELYEKALREFPYEKDLQKRYSRVRIQCDIQKRFRDSYYCEYVENMSAAELKNFVQSVMQTHSENFVFELTPNEIFFREICSLEIALGDSFFCENVLQGQDSKKVFEFIKKIHALPDRVSLRSLEDVQNTTIQLGMCCERQFGKNASFFVMECLFGFVTSLDPYSEVLLPVQHQDLLSSIHGKMVGVGIEFRTNEAETYITAIIPNTSASASDLKVGDRILAVNGSSISGATLERVSEMMQGDAETWLTVFARTGNDAPRTVKMQRKAIRYGCIEESCIYPNTTDVGYVRISSFQQNSPMELHRAMQELYAKGMRKLILDLRGNLGGSLMAGVEMADMFVSNGILLKTRNERNLHENPGERKEMLYTAHPQGTWNIPVILLIDEHSASATEVFAGALVENNRALALGNRTFGKGAVQGIFPISDTDFALKVTISHLYSPNGNKYNHRGVTPNFPSPAYEAAKPALQKTEEIAVTKLTPEEAENAFRAEAAAGSNTGSSSDVTSGTASDTVLQTAVQVFTSAR